MSDSLLRKHGFRIRSRPVGQESLWEKDGRLHPESRALIIAQRAEWAEQKALKEKRHGRRKES